MIHKPINIKFSKYIFTTIVVNMAKRSMSKETVFLGSPSDRWHFLSPLFRFYHIQLKY